MTDTRLAGADFVRALACLIVVGHHLSQRMSWNIGLGWMEWARVFAQLGGFGVAMFFVLSGYLLAQPFWRALDAGAPLPSLRTYAIRRAARILPGYWLALTVTFVLTITVFGMPLTGQLVGRYLAGFFLVADWHWVTFFPVEINGPLWSISFEVTSYVLLPLGFIALFAVAGRVGAAWSRRLLWLLVIGLALLGQFAFTSLFQPDPLNRSWDYGLLGGAKLWMMNFNAFGFFAMFAIGALAAGLQVRLARLRHWAFDLAAVAAFAIVTAILAWQSRQDGTESYGLLGIPYIFPWFQLAVGLALALTPSSRLLGAALDNPVTRYVARISFGVYVWHYVVLELVRLGFAPDMQQGTMQSPGRFALLAAIIVAGSLAIGTLSYYLLEAPAIRWARGFERRPAPAAPTLSPAAG